MSRVVVVPSIKPHKPRFHILGPGSIGSLFAYYFHKHHIPFTLFRRSAPPPLPPHYERKDVATHGNTFPSYDIPSSYPPTTLKYMNLTSLHSHPADPKAIDGVNWEPLYPIIDKELFRHDPTYNELSRAPIHQLLVTTKTHQTVAAMSKIRHRLRPWSTIVLMQNGMGILEEICQSMGWAHEDERPNFIQGIITHGAQKIDDTIMHTGRGQVWLSPILGPFISTESTSTVRRRRSTPTINQLLKKDNLGVSPFPEVIKPGESTLLEPYPRPKATVPFVAPFTDAPFSSFYDAPSNPEALRLLRIRSFYETFAALQELSTDMDLRIIMPDRLLALQISKLVVNACVNPVATLLETSNGGLLDASDNAHQAVKDLLKESHYILNRSQEYQNLNEDLRQEFLTLEALTKTTEGILRVTRMNRCSTLQDYMKGSQQCEIEYMNGYLIKMAERDSLPGKKAESVAPLNRRVTERIKEKFATPRQVTE
ncbi:2-dehydropantoate 2-reductase (Ketopantoate reductase) (KPA reductase) (KPR) [Modicella reniformis]|uniref:2-dehydropantoate 2-reductase (Ketopantoate reductase) (KPA reductase) (KPR) n=1 Tax=Modicella reniformis TaxID=1440133 RepID=A0A9P6MAM8_9FUNG|nr:2-dehydropantoate 2-reductase (Ketopantoate reductase) (KPA reductase) (KPR) [Modicella reniformis]